MTQKTIYLHIGRHKTGTSSIQHFVNGCPEMLADLNLYYPQVGKSTIAHHDLAGLLAIQSNKTAEAQQQTLQSPDLAALLEEINNQPCNVLLSSESFQNSHPTVIQQAFANYDLRVLVYIRNQIDYLASSYAQRVWATPYCESMEHYYDNVFSVDYFGFLNRWQDACSGKITVRKFERQSLSENDIVVDFFENMLNISDNSVKQQIINRELEDANPSLTSDLLAYKLRYNESAPDCSEAQQRIVRQALAQLSLKKESPPVRVTSELKERCVQSSTPINEKVSKLYFNSEELFSLDRPTGNPSVLSRENFIDISEKLIALDSRISSQILEFTEATYPTRKVS